MRLLLVLGLALLVVPAALAAKFNYTVTTADPVTAPRVTLSGADQTKTFPIVTEVSYTNGNNSKGWNVTASATTPTTGTQTLPALQVTAGSFSCASSCDTNPSPTGITYPITMSGSAEIIYNANTDTGQGDFYITSTFKLTYPANIFPGTYSSTVTIAASTGPS